MLSTITVNHYYGRYMKEIRLYIYIFVTYYKF